MFTYRIAILGTVSSGKSTLINSIFAKHLSSMNIKRTTMTPQIYNFTTENQKGDSIEDILRSNKEANDDFISGWDGFTIREHQVPNPPDFIVGNPHLQFKIYDLPGLNDADTKETYMSWAENNFYLFDLAILVTDVQHIFNTSDEMDICRLIFRKMQENPHINLIILINKCDNMEIIDSTNQLKCADSELEDIINAQLMQNINSLTNTHEIDSYRINIVRKSSKNAFVYRAIQHNPLSEISNHIEEKFLNEILESELGKSKWRTFTDTQKKKAKDDKIVELKEEDFYRANMKYCGFRDLTNVINNVTTDPKITESYYLKNVKNFIDSENKKLSIVLEEVDITKITNAFNSIKSSFSSYIFYVDSTKIPVEIKNEIINKVINEYLIIHENYNFDIGEQKLFNIHISIIFDDIKGFQNFEDEMKKISYVDKLNHSINFYTRAFLYTKERINFFNGKTVFKKIIDRMEVCNERYGLKNNPDYSVEELINIYMTPDLWNSQKDREKEKFFEWLLKKGLKNITNFFAKCIEEKMYENTCENVYYLKKMRNQLKDAGKDDLSIFCELQCEIIWSEMGRPKINASDFSKFKDYDKKYGDFTTYLINNFTI